MKWRENHPPLKARHSVGIVDTSILNTGHVKGCDIPTQYVRRKSASNRMCTSCDLVLELISRLHKERLVLGRQVGWISPTSATAEKNVTHLIATCKLNHPASSSQLIGRLAQELRLLVQVIMPHPFPSVLRRLEWKSAMSMAKGHLQRAQT